MKKAKNVTETLRHLTNVEKQRLAYSSEFEGTQMMLQHLNLHEFNNVRDWT